ncbi:MAG: toxin-antitoxin system, antitoxin component, Xre family protein [Acidobacteria bacterium]|nr:toxin-antitoxin system, antitoxin component, Xre family protein [Acidobacteriota bacterium]
MNGLTNRDLEFIEKVHRLPEERRAILEQIVDAYLSRAARADRELTQEAGRLSESVLKEIWDNPEDAVYDRL